jgi:hypothetical protein
MNKLYQGEMLSRTRPRLWPNWMASAKLAKLPVDAGRVAKVVNY